MEIARTLKKFLQAQDVRFELLRHRYAEGSYDTARCAQVPSQQLLKGVVFRDEDFRYTMAVVPSNHRVLRHTLNDIFGGNLQLAEEDELDLLFFDCAHGAIPALGQAYGMNIIWDHSLADTAEVWLEAGDHCHLLGLEQTDFRRLMSPHLSDTISRERKRFSLKLVTQAQPEPGSDTILPRMTAPRLAARPQA